MEGVNVHESFAATLIFFFEDLPKQWLSPIAVGWIGRAFMLSAEKAGPYCSWAFVLDRSTTIGLSPRTKAIAAHLAVPPSLR